MADMIIEQIAWALRFTLRVLIRMSILITNLIRHWRSRPIIRK